MSYAGDGRRSVRSTGTQLDEHWAVVLGCPAPGPCYLCRKTRRAAVCERWEASLDVMRQLEPSKLTSDRPTRAVVCKDCCIATLEGHKCVWWDFCWSM